MRPTIEKNDIIASFFDLFGSVCYFLPMFRKESLILAALILVKAILMVELILRGPIGLGPDEAQYWTWSQNLDWGYYSKPPGIAWQIWLGTQLFGSNPLGVRFFSILIGSLLPILIYVTAQRSSVSPKWALCGAVAFALSPMGILSSLFAITDGGMLLFWTACLAYLGPSLFEKKTPNYLIVGFLIGCGALFKWPIYFLWILLLVCWPFHRWMVSSQALLGLGISLLGLLPSVYWNSQHDFATFRHVFSTVSGGHGRGSGLFAGNPLEFIGSQLAIASPILFILICAALFLAFRRYRQISPPIQFFALATAVILLGGFGMSLFMKMQGNWPIAAYPSAFVLLSWFIQDNSKAYRWTVAGVALSVALTLAAFAIPTLQEQSITGQIPYKVNPFRHNIGWGQLDSALTKAGYHPAADALISDKYQTVSELSFYGPEQNMAHFFNLMGVRKNQFSYWPKLTSQSGKRCFFVVVENIPQLNDPTLTTNYLERLAPYFGSVRLVEIAPLFLANGSVSKGALIFECLDFKGKYPVDPDLY